MKPAILGAIAGGGAAYVDPSVVITLTNLSLITAEAAETYLGNGGSGLVCYGRGGALSLPLNGDGWIETKWELTPGAHILAFSTNPAATETTFLSFQLQLSTTASDFRQGINNVPGTGTTTVESATPAVGTRFRLKRTSGTFTIDKSTNAGQTWSTRYTFAGSSTAQLYPIFFTNNGSRFRRPAHVGLA